MSKCEADAKLLKGFCKLMCPKKEFEFRRKNNLIHVLEKTCDGQVDASLCVKEFRRSAAGEKLSNPHHLRPSRILIQTIKYLIEKIAFQKHKSPRLVYDFVFDRLRSVRQDAVIQQLSLTTPEVAMDILARCSRYYMYAHYRHLTDNKFAIDKHINYNHLQDSLASLVGLYFDHHDVIYNQMTSSSSQRRVHMDMLAVYLLLNIDSQQILLHVLKKVPREWRNDLTFGKVIKLCVVNVSKNYYNMVRIIQDIATSCSGILMFALAIVLADAREKLLTMLCVSHHSKMTRFPLSVLSQWFYVNGMEDMKRFCCEHNLDLLEDGAVKLSKVQFKPGDNIYFPSCPIIQQINDFDLSYIISF